MNTEMTTAAKAELSYHDVVCQKNEEEISNNGAGLAFVSLVLHHALYTYWSFSHRPTDGEDLVL